jgi:hypothetical protein
MTISTNEPSGIMQLKTALTIITVCITAAVTSLEAKSILFRNGKTAYTIVTCSDASVSELTAAKELSTYLNSISGAEFPVVKEDEADLKGRHIFIGYSPAYGKDMQADRPEDDFEGFRYCNVGKDIWIYGGKGRGTMYGVFSFLENELGVRWYASDCTKVPSLKVWGFEKLDVSERPAIRYRFTQYRNVERNPEWLAHNKNNSVWNACENEYGGLSSYWNAHTFEQFIPSDKYFREHPEYFSLRDGERKPYTQLCLSNPEVLQICIERMKESIAANPLCWVYSMSQSDNQFPCKCENCRAIEKQYGGHSGLIIWFVNQVADAIKPIYPDKYIGTFAYQYTRQAPKGIKPRDNVVIRLCSIECCFAHSLEECAHNRPFIDDIREWSEIAPHLFIWDYVVNYRQYLAPFPNFQVLADNIKTFRKYNAIGIQEEAQYQSFGGEFSDMKSWVIAKLLWNPELDTDALTSEFISNYYGAAAPYVQKYFDLCRSLVKPDTVMGIYIDHKNPLYTDEFINEASSLIKAAVGSVKDEDETIRHRVDLVRLQTEYLRIMRNPQETASDGTKEWFCEFVLKHGIRINEGTKTEKFVESLQ